MKHDVLFFHQLGNADFNAIECKMSRWQLSITDNIRHSTNIVNSNQYCVHTDYWRLSYKN